MFVRCLQRGLRAVILIAIIAMMAGNAFAQTNNDTLQAPPTAAEKVTEYEFDLSPVGSVGSLIAANLESAGHAAQSTALDFFKDGFQSSFGALIYIIGAMAAVLIIAIGGNYKYGLWLLVGPFAAYIMLYPREESAGARWTFGGRNYERLEAIDSRSDVAPRPTNLPSMEGKQPGPSDQLLLRSGQKVGDVSWFFGWWDNFSSSFVNEVIKVLKLDVRQTDLSFIAKTQRYSNLMSLQVEDPAILGFLNLTMRTGCEDYFGAMRDLYNANMRLNFADEPRKAFIERWVVPLGNKRVQTDTAAFRQVLESGYIYELTQTDSQGRPILPYIKDGARRFINDAEGQRYLRSLGTISCAGVWQLSLNALKHHACDLMRGVLVGTKPPGLNDAQLAQYLQEETVRLLNKVKNSCVKHYEDRCNRELSADREKCFQRMLEARRRAESNQSQARVGSVSCEMPNSASTEPPSAHRTASDTFDFEDEYGRGYMNCLNPDQQMLMFVNEIAARMLIGELRKAAPHSLLPEWSKDLPRQSISRDNETLLNLRESMAGFEYEGKGIFFSAILAMPYVQGIGLYFLALAYPFVCLALVYPGRHYAVLQWMALWFWIKSWDIGFAVVMMLDELLYNLLPHGPPVTNAVASDPAETLKTILEVDPAFSVFTYFNILGTLLGSVPLVTGLLVKHGGGGVVGALRHGFYNFSGRIGFAMLQYQTAMRNMDLSEGVMKNERQAYHRAQVTALLDPEVLLPLATNTLAPAVLERLQNGSGTTDDMKALRKAVNPERFFRGDISRKAVALAIAKYKRNVSYAVYNESQSAHNLLLAHDTIINWYSNHDFITAHPYSKDLEYERAKLELRRSAIREGIDAIAGGLAERGTQVFRGRR